MMEIVRYSVSMFISEQKQTSVTTPSIVFSITSERGACVRDNTGSFADYCFIWFIREAAQIGAL